MNHKQSTRFLLALVFLLFNCACLFAQAKRISGKVTHQSSGEPLQGVSFGIKGSTRTVITNAEGVFSITVPSSDAVLTFSYVGLDTREMKVGHNTSLSVSMAAANQKLDEVVIIGYGQVKKRDLTGSVVSLKSEEVTKVPATAPIEAQRPIPQAQLDAVTNNGEFIQNTGYGSENKRSL